jgi:hypothetical protein
MGMLASRSTFTNPMIFLPERAEEYNAYSARSVILQPIQHRPIIVQCNYTTPLRKSNLK